VLFRFANDGGMGPVILFSSICILSSTGRWPSSSGRSPVSLFPLRSLQKLYLIRKKAEIL